MSVYKVDKEGRQFLLMMLLCCLFFSMIWLFMSILSTDHDRLFLLCFAFIIAIGPSYDFFTKPLEIELSCDKNMISFKSRIRNREFLISDLKSIKKNKWFRGQGDDLHFIFESKKIKMDARVNCLEQIVGTLRELNPLIVTKGM